MGILGNNKVDLFRPSDGVGPFLKQWFILSLIIYWSILSIIGLIKWGKVSHGVIRFNQCILYLVLFKLCLILLAAFQFGSVLLIFEIFFL